MTTTFRRARTGLYIPRATGGGTYDSILAALSPVGDWRLDEASGTTAAAVAGSAGTIASSGVTYSQTGLVNDGGTSLKFDGNTGEVQCPIPSLGSTNPAGTIIFWFKSIASGDGWVVRSHVASGGWIVNANVTNVSATLNGSNHSTSALSSTYLDQVRHMIVLTCDGTTAKLYIDGTQLDSWASTAAFWTLGTQSPLHIGRSGSNTGTTNFFNGFYDRPSVIQAAITATDVTNLWNAGK